MDHSQPRNTTDSRHGTIEARSGQAVPSLGSSFNSTLPNVECGVTCSRGSEQGAAHM